ncbi:tRNA (adenosine(37)-N6)-threonylcarbamoyltransferase complex dimerization subunit type 1 TsaB [Acidobacteriota bacterium]
MRILGIDTSSRALSIAIMEDGVLIGSLNTQSVMTHSVRLLPGLEALLDRAGLDVRAIEIMAICVGPGSFTGIRIGLSTAKALAFTMDCSMVGVSTLEALARASAVSGETLVPLVDAGRNEVYRAVFKTGKDGALTRLMDDELAPAPSAFLDDVPRGAVFVGPAVLRHKEAIETAWSGEVRLLPGSPFLGESVARLGYEAALKKKTALPHELDANYIRKSDAEVKSGR